MLEAITLHLNPAVPREQGAVQHLTHDGVLLDVLGVRAWELDPEASSASPKTTPGSASRSPPSPFCMDTAAGSTAAAPAPSSSPASGRR